MINVRSATDGDTARSAIRVDVGIPIKHYVPTQKDPCSGSRKFHVSAKTKITPSTDQRATQSHFRRKSLPSNQYPEPPSKANHGLENLRNKKSQLAQGQCLIHRNPAPSKSL